MKRNYRKYLTRLFRFKTAFELLAEAKLLDLDDEPKYWKILEKIDKIYKERRVI